MVENVNINYWEQVTDSWTHCGSWSREEGGGRRGGEAGTERRGGQGQGGGRRRGGGAGTGRKGGAGQGHRTWGAGAGTQDMGGLFLRLGLQPSGLGEVAGFSSLL